MPEQQNGKPTSKEQKKKGIHRQDNSIGLYSLYDIHATDRYKASFFLFLWSVFTSKAQGKYSIAIIYEVNQISSTMPPLPNDPLPPGPSFPPHTLAPQKNSAQLNMRRQK